MVGLAVNPEILPEVPQMFQLIIRFPPFTHWIFGRDLEPGINILGTSGCQGVTVSLHGSFEYRKSAEWVKFVLDHHQGTENEPHIFIV